MAAFACPVDVLGQAPLVALDDVVAAGTRRPLRRQGEAELAEHRGLAWNREPADLDAGDRELPRRRDEVDIVAAPRSTRALSMPAVDVSTPPWKEKGRQMTATFIVSP